MTNIIVIIGNDNFILSIPLKDIVALVVFILKPKKRPKIHNQIRLMPISTLELILKFFEIFFSENPVQEVGDESLVWCKKKETKSNPWWV